MQHPSIAEAGEARRSAAPSRRNDWAAIRTLLPYLWEFKGRVILALSFLVTAKLANVAVPLTNRVAAPFGRNTTSVSAIGGSAPPGLIQVRTRP